jgi:phage shock protein PspC (stress-responsive transcriptional regulator)
VIPIEEPAYDELKKYIESLRVYFANEEGKEEIVNDIENRIAELFNEKLKNGFTFISTAHVEAIIASMGRPEQFDELKFETGEEKSFRETSYINEPRGSLYRDSNDKILGGVCSGLASYLKLDTTLVRVLFAMLALGSFGTGALLYIILWAILPKRNLAPITITRKLYRDAEQKVIGGVCSGIAQYFNIAVWIPRLIFVLPLFVSLFKIPFTLLFFPFAASFSGTMFIIYIILWVVVPKAVTASEKLEMKGQKVDLNSIKNKVQDELQGVKTTFSGKADQWKNSASSKMSEFGEEVGQAAKTFSGEAGPAAKKAGNAFLRFVATVFKVFFLFIFGIIAIALVAASFGIGAAVSLLLPLKQFIANGEMVQWYALGTLLFFILVPIVAIIQWLIRSIIGHKTRSNSIAITLSSLWILGWVSMILLVSSVSKQFRRVGSVQSEVGLVQPSVPKMLINFSKATGNYYPLDPWENDFDYEQDTDGILLSKNEDSLLLSNIRLRLLKSNDAQFHVSMIRRSRAESAQQAESYAEKIKYTVVQQDSILILPNAFPITKQDKFHNQQIIIEVQVPVGKEIYVDGKNETLSWYTIRGGAKGLNISIDDDETNWRSGVWYIMTETGIEKKYKDQLDIQSDKLDREMEQMEKDLREEIETENKRVEKMNSKLSLNKFHPSSDEYAVGVEDPAETQSASKVSHLILFGAQKLLKLRN